jgi:hypothetical protein
MIDKPRRSLDKGRQAPRRDADEQAVDDELTEALKGTFPGSDPVALESPLVNRAPKDKPS